MRHFYSQNEKYKVSNEVKKISLFCKKVEDCGNGSANICQPIVFFHYVNTKIFMEGIYPASFFIMSSFLLASEN